MKKIIAVIGAVAAVSLIAVGVAAATTTLGPTTAGGLIVRTESEGITLSTSYQAVIPRCPDATWQAVGGGFYFDYPAPAADDITIRASQRDINGSGVQGWLIDAKWDASISGQSRAIVAEVECVKVA